jgi:hypothetical protein
LRECPDELIVAELRALLGELADVATRCSNALWPVHERCTRYLKSAPHLHLGDGKAVEMTDEGDSGGSQMGDVTVGLSPPDIVRCGECGETYASPLVLAEGWDFEGGKPTRHCACGALMMVAGLGIGSPAPAT